MHKPTITLSEEQIAFFHREGYLTIPAITTSEEIERLREIFDHLVAISAGREEGNQYDLAGTDEDNEAAVLPQIVNPSNYAPELEEALCRANAYAIAKQLLGPKAKPQSEHAIMKPPEIGAATPWHQDEAYWAPDLEYDSPQRLDALTRGYAGEWLYALHPPQSQTRGDAPSPYWS